MNLSDEHKEYIKAIETLNEKGKAIRDNVNAPKHYEVLPGVEVYDIREAILSKNPHLHPCVADDWSRASEYLLRMFGKNGLEDAKKARWYLDKLVQRMEAMDEEESKGKI